MSSERIWIVILAAVCFLAGAAGGILWATGLQPAPDHGPYGDFITRFATTFDLDVREARDLRYVLERYHGDVEELKAQYVREMEPELVQLGQVCRDRIRKYVLPPNQVEAFDRLCAGRPLDPALPPAQ